MYVTGCRLWVVKMIFNMSLHAEGFIFDAEV